MDRTSAPPPPLPRTNRPADAQRHRQTLAEPSLILVAKPTSDVDPPDSLPAQPPERPPEEGIEPDRRRRSQSPLFASLDTVARGKSESEAKALARYLWILFPSSLWNLVCIVGALAYMSF